MTRPFLVSLLLSLLVGTTSADILVVGNQRIRGAILSETEDEVVINTFNSRHPDATNGTERFPRARIRKIIREVDPLHEARRLAAKAKTVEDLLALAAHCEEHKLKIERERALLRAFAMDPTDEAVRKEITPTRAEKSVRADPSLDPELAQALKAYLEIEDPGDRKDARKALKGRFGYDPGDLYLERAWRSARSPRGKHEDRALTLRAREIKAVYTLLVPKGYDPFVPHPLVIGLHGGGPGGKERDLVVGSGRTAMQKYGRHAAGRNWIAACPTAVVAGWNSKPNHELVLALVEEMALLYNIDRNRIYLIGHSMGGYGTFALGPAYAETWAACSPMSGGGGGNVGQLANTSTGTYIYHSDDDSVCGVDGSRRPAKSLRDKGADFVYTEVTGAGHGIARGVMDEIFEFFAVRTLAKGRGRRFLPTHEPDSSFDAKVSREEKTYFGDPLAKAPARESDDRKRKQLLADLLKGGGAAEKAADDLIALADEKSRKPLGDLAASPRNPEDVRAQACRVLGRIGDEASVRPLSTALRDKESFRVRDAAAAALGVLSSAEGVAPLVSSLDAEWRVFESKLIGGDRLHYSDWDVLLRSFSIRSRALATLGDASAVEALRRVLVTRVFGRPWRVAANPRAGQSADRPRNACGTVLAETLEKLGGDEAIAALEELRGHFSSSASVSRRCEQAIETIRRNTK